MVLLFVFDIDEEVSRRGGELAVMIVKKWHGVSATATVHEGTLEFFFKAHMNAGVSCKLLFMTPGVESIGFPLTISFVSWKNPN